MSAVFVDSNIFLRFLTMDSQGEHERAAALLRRAAAKKIQLVTCPPVLFEVAWTLKAAYNVPNEKILDALSAIAVTPGLTLQDADLVTDAIALAQQSASDFADAFIAASAIKLAGGKIATFNRKHFLRLGVELAQL